MNSNHSKKIQPSDLILFVDSEITAGPGTVFHISLLGQEAYNAFGQANEALFRQNPGWEKIYEQAAAKFKKIAGFRPEAVYEAMAELRQGKGLTPLVDRQGRPQSEALDRISTRRKEG